MPNPVTHFEITGQDAKALQEYYGTLFGWEINADNPMNYGMIAAQDRGAGGGIGPAMQGPGMVTFYVEVDDVQAYLDKAVSLGGTVVAPKMDVPDGPTIALFADPEGHVIGIAQGM